MKVLALSVAGSFVGGLLALLVAYAYFMSPLPLPTFGWVWPR